MTTAPDVSENANLWDLFLASNMLITPPDLTGLTELLLFEFGRNRLTTPPVVSAATTTLKVLYLHNNMLESLPDLSANTALTQLVLYNNPATGSTTLPSLGSTTSLKWVYVGWHNPSLTLPSGFLTGLPDTLTRLYLEGFDLTAGELSTIGSRFTGLQHLFVGGSGLSAAETNTLLDALPVSLVGLSLDGNDLSDVDWTKLTRLTGLRVLDVTGANLDDSDAADIATYAPAWLSNLRMGYNALTAVPSLSRFTRLTLLVLEHNNLDDADLTANTFAGPPPQADSGDHRRQPRDHQYHRRAQ